MFGRPIVYRTERKIATQLLRHLQYPRPNTMHMWTNDTTNMMLNSEQALGVQMAFEHGVIITGGPGTGLQLCAISLPMHNLLMSNGF